MLFVLMLPFSRSLAIVLQPLVMAYMEMIGNYSATTHHLHHGHPGSGVAGDLLSYDARAISAHSGAEFQQRSVR